MASVNENECIAAGLDPKEVKRIADGMSRYAKEAAKLGLEVFGGGSGDLRQHNAGRPGLIVANLDGVFNGGDGASREDEDGLLRGEG